MVQHIHGSLYYERMGRTGPVIAFIHPTRWTSRADFFRWRTYRPGIAALPSTSRDTAARQGGRRLTMTTWPRPVGKRSTTRCRRKSDSGRLFGGLVARSPHVPPAPRQNRSTRVVGHRLQPQQGIIKGRIDNYTANGIDYRWAYTFEDLSPAFAPHRWHTFSANLHRAQRTRRRADDHPPVQSARAALSGGPS